MELIPGTVIATRTSITLVISPGRELNTITLLKGRMTKTTPQCQGVLVEFKGWILGGEGTIVNCLRLVLTDKLIDLTRFAG